MKHILRLVSLVALLALLLVGCTKQTPPEDEVVYYTVSFDANGGTDVPSMTVQAGGQISEPEEPTRENYIFDGWKNGTETWIFTYHNVNSDVTLKASWKSAADVFGYRSLEGTEDAILTELKSEHATLLVPTTINGFRVVGLDDGIFSQLSSENVKKIIVPDSVTEIGEGAFADSTGIEIVIEGCLLTLGEQAFLNCDGLKAVCLAEGLTRIPFEVFKGSGIQALTTPSSLAVIEESAFQNCQSLKTAVLHSTLALAESFLVIEDGAFRGCDGLKSVFLYGTEADQTAILDKTDNQNAPLLAATFYYYSESEPTAAGHYWYVHDGEPRVW